LIVVQKNKLRIRTQNASEGLKKDVLRHGTRASGWAAMEMRDKEDGHNPISDIGWKIKGNWGHRGREAIELKVKTPKNRRVR